MNKRSDCFTILSLTAELPVFLEGFVDLVNKQQEIKEHQYYRSISKIKLKLSVLHLNATINIIMFCFPTLRHLHSGQAARTHSV